MKLNIEFKESNQTFGVDFGEYAGAPPAAGDCVKSVNGIKPDENGNVDVISPVKIAELISALQ